MKIGSTSLALALALVTLSFAQTAAVEPAPTPPALRLPRTFLPTAYAAHLVVTPVEATFRGHIDIDARLTEATRLIWLNGQDLTITEAALTTANGDRVSLEVLPAEESFVAFRAEREVPAGRVTLSIAYSGLVDPNNTDGIFHQKDGDAWYTFTQFEAITARRAFPCFDEPDVKVPWQLTLEVPEETLAVSNTPIVSEQPGTNGMKTVTFARTKPFPSYMIAFAVGPFDVVDAGKTRTGAALRIVVPRGRSAEAKWAVASTLPLLTLLEDYFGTPYPYEKLDMVAIPQTVGFGAMENPGMITYAQRILLRKEEESTIGFRRGYAETAAHEIAHQWFGDLVTMAWWDDLWLNEAFATWMGGKVVTAWKPEWDGAVDMVEERSGAMRADSLKSARKIHQPIESENDIKNAFDGITYGKGAAVIRMFESWVGPEVFQKGIRRYLAEHAWKNATSVDFLNAIGEAAGLDVVTPFSTFLDQVGSPIVSFELTCVRGATPVLTLAQKRYVPLGSTANADQVWQIPICVKYATGKIEARACTLMTTATAELPLVQSKTCPSWVLPNAGGLGYYRVRPEGELIDRLFAHGMRKLSLPERIGVIGDVDALVGSGQIPAGDALALVDTLEEDGNRHVVGAAVGIAEDPDEIIGAALRPNYERFVRKVFGARAKALGWTPKKGEDEDTRILRNAVVGLVARQGGDKALVAEATRLAWAWLDDHKSLDAEMVRLVLDVAARNGDRKLYDRLHADAKKADSLEERRKLLGPMGRFSDPEIAKVALALTLKDEFDPREVIGTMLWGALGDPRTRPMAYEFVKTNFDALVAKLPREWASGLVYAGVAQCDATLRREVEDFFKERNAKLSGGPLVFTQGLEEMDLCIARREALRPGIEAFLKKF